MNENTKEYWNNDYWKDNILKNKTDFIKDIWLNNYLDILGTCNNKIAIDLGCGIGQDTAFLINSGFDVISCDISDVALKQLKERLPNARIKQLDLKEHLPFDDNSVGLVNADLSIHYFNYNDTKDILKEIYRILDYSGIFIGRVNSTNNDDYIKESTKIIEDNFYYDYGRFFRLFDKNQLENLGKEFNIVSLNEDVTIRLERRKALWEFVFMKGEKYGTCDIR